MDQFRRSSPNWHQPPGSWPALGSQFSVSETLALPEGEGDASKALVKFAKVDKSAGLLGRDVVRFDCASRAR